MTKEELKRKCTERAKIFQQAMESCHSSSPMDCIEWFADRIAELKARLNAINLLTPELQKRSQLKTQQLTKAKEIIKKMSYEYQRLCLIKKETLTEAEQFIKDSEVEK